MLVKLKFLSLFLAWIACSHANEQPNVLFVISDDLMKQVEVYGHTEIKTPELKKFSEEALRFDRAYCQYPLCGPSRASLMLSKYPGNSGILWNKAGKSDNTQKIAQKLNTMTMPAFFKQHGYITIGGGKLYHNSVIPDAPDTSVDFSVAFANTGHNGKKKQIKNPKTGLKSKRYAMTEASEKGIYEHIDGSLIQQAKEWLTEHAQSGKQQPFFMCIGMKKPHAPFSCPKTFWDRYKREDMTPIDVAAPNNILTEYSLSAPNALLRTAYDTAHYTGETLPESKARELMHGYYACVSYTDHLFGDLIQTLKQNGQYNNTIVVFTSDHGYKLGEYQRWGKFTLHEKDAVVPFLIRAPQTIKHSGATTNAIVGLIDIYPTLAELCELPAPPNVDGQSFVKTLKDPTFSARQHIRTVRPHSDHVAGVSIIHQNGYRYKHFYKGALSTPPTDLSEILADELYDHYTNNNTASSIKNLNKEQPELIQTMRNIALRK